MGAVGREWGGGRGGGGCAVKVNGWLWLEGRVGAAVRYK